MPRRTANYRQGLLEDLLDPQEAAFYVQAALSESTELFLRALRDVAESRQMSKVAKEAGVAREALYRMLSETGNPTLNSLSAILSTVGLEIRIEPVAPESGSTTLAPTVPQQEIHAAIRSVIDHSAIAQLSPQGMVTSTHGLGGFWESAGHTGGLITGKFTASTGRTAVVQTSLEDGFQRTITQVQLPN